MITIDKKEFLNSSDFINLLKENGFSVKNAQFSKLKAKGVLPPPDILLGLENPRSGWKEETVNDYIDKLKNVQSELKKQNVVGVTQLGNWFNS
ncbi:hypothetical protein P5624_00170 (plasmid) [Bacillus subtilis]|uniref:hypothetical protein n=1 Tax=Bacillus subtilis group TaxID=653685 RepID=UPI00084A1EF4|nr:MULTISPECIES: hypothetical protein [Bacillus subtilis group]MCY9367501.1 hypothetical protein [Bacillus spizizenii]MCY9311640.1 hypothetical protein [Bacillus inaquosorum]ODV47887.1 hypothetical protein BCM26_05620 [Bacillus subtilis]OJH63485.1 hypothetical protein BOH71_09560 [Bacillus subtilis]WEY90783.1 hypothetical protein P5624_00170 [Bacillus subtilis]